MNILLITNYFPKSDKKQEAIFLYWRARELVKAGHSVTILKWNQNLRDYFKKPYVLDFKDPLFDVDIPVIPIHTVQSKNRLNQNRTYKWIKNNFDIVHFHWLWSMTVFPSIKNGIFHLL